MTRFKEYVRSKGTMLECDFRNLKIDMSNTGTDRILVLPEQAKVLKHHKISGWCELTFYQDGRFTISNTTPEILAEAINRGLPWWEQVDPEDIAAACF